MDNVMIRVCRMHLIHFRHYDCVCVYSPCLLEFVQCPYIYYMEIAKIARLYSNNILLYCGVVMWLENG